MIGAGLSLDQAPPFSVPLRFYLTAPLFLAAAGILAASAAPGWSADRWSAATLALTHLVALGYLGMVMLGSLMQMLPVVAGSPVPAVRTVARLAHAGLLAGTPLLAWGLADGRAAPLLAGSLLLAGALAAFLAGALASLMRAANTATVQAMRWAWGGLFGTLAAGLALAAWLSGHAYGVLPGATVAAHAALGLLGWMAMLVIGVAYQVVPMLQVTPAYPATLMRWLAALLAGQLFLFIMAILAGDMETLQGVLAAGIGTTLLLFALATLDLLRRRRRRLGDATLDYWRLGMLSLALSALLGTAGWLLPGRMPPGWEILLGMLFLVGFASSVVNGMLMKIVPFLAWFHLHAQVGLARTPFGSMKDFLPDSAARLQFVLHATALTCLLPSPWLPWLALPGGLLLATSALQMQWQLWRAWRLFARYGGRA